VVENSSFYEGVDRQYFLTAYPGPSLKKEPTPGPSLKKEPTPVPSLKGRGMMAVFVGCVNN
jgi:hypothetical protein